MSLGYQQTDAHIVDYRLYELPGCEGRFRGPPPVSPDYVACLGGAQTFGRFVERPFPRLLGNALNMDALNLGRGGAGPGFPLSSPALLARINGARLVIVQVFSGRSQSNSMFRTLRDGMRGINEVTGAEMSADEFYTWLLERDGDVARRIVAETRDNYVMAMKRLLAAIEPPKILLWFSTRTADYAERWELTVGRLLGAFPQLVNRAMIEQLRDCADRYVECISSRGSPQPIVDAAGAPDLNRYYPSPEMHEDATQLLAPLCRSLLLQGGPGADHPFGPPGAISER